MAPVTRSSLHGRSISREGSWQLPTVEDIQPGDSALEVARNAESVEDGTTVEDQSDDELDEDPFHENQGMYLRADDICDSLSHIV
jgi:hypothetical protein